MNMSLDDIIKTNKDNTTVNNKRGYIKNSGYIKKNTSYSHQANIGDNKEKSFFKNNLNNRQKLSNRDYNDRVYNSKINPNYRNKFENLNRTKVFSP